MALLHKSSLGVTIDALNDALFFRRRTSATDRLSAARWIASRQGLPGSYSNMFAPTERDFTDGITFFTGETIKTGAGTSHILGEEACRALKLLAPRDAVARRAFDAAVAGISDRLAPSDVSRSGRYCCFKCTVALWRNLASGALPDFTRALAPGMKLLRSARADNGRWHGFPFYYTLLALLEIDTPAARAELRHAAPACRRALKSVKGNGKYAIRRRALAERALDKV